MTRLLVCAPLAIEARALRRGLSAGPVDVTVIRTGLGNGRTGRARARRPGAASWLIRDCGAVAVAGFGGALNSALRPGDVLVATEVWSDGRRMPCDAAELLATELARVGVRALTGPLISTDHVVRGAERRWLSRTGARAVDMEAGLLVAAAGGLPVTVVRAIVDTPDRPLLSTASLVGGLVARRTLRRIGPALMNWATGTPGTPRAAPPEEVIL